MTNISYKDKIIKSLIIKSIYFIKVQKVQLE